MGLIQANIHPLLGALESACGHKVIAYFLDEQGAIADEQVFHLYEHLRRLGKQDVLCLWIHSRGGATEVPWKMVSLLREFSDHISVLVPYRALSAATQIALGADEIVMTEMGELGPVDPSRRHPLLPREEVRTGERKPIPISVQDLRHVLKFLEREIGKDKLTPEAAATVYTALFEKVHPLAIGALEQSWALAQQVSEGLLLTHMKGDGAAERVKAIVDRLSDHYKSHLYQIGRREAREMGLPVRDATAAEAHAMWELYLGYMNVQIVGEGMADKEPILLRRLGHIDSTCAITTGMELVRKSDGESIGARWASRWLVAPAVPQP